jgi:hypothetical protein
LGIGVLYLVSDRAKALVKLAQTGLSCLSIPDMFHLSHDLGKGYALSIFGRLRQAQQAQVSVEHCEASVQRWQGVRSAYRQRLTNLSRIIHPWRLMDSSRRMRFDQE